MLKLQAILSTICYTSAFLPGQPKICRGKDIRRRTCPADDFNKNKYGSLNFLSRSFSAPKPTKLTIDRVEEKEVGQDKISKMSASIMPVKDDNISMKPLLTWAISRAFHHKLSKQSALIFCCCFFWRGGGEGGGVGKNNTRHQIRERISKQ